MDIFQNRADTSVSKFLREKKVLMRLCPFALAQAVLGYQSPMVHLHILI